MKLFHFTSHLHLPYILKEGISYGDVPLTMTGKHGEDTAVWLTKDKMPNNQGWQNKKNKGPFIDKTAIRLRVEIPTEFDYLLYSWSDYARMKNVDDVWRAALERAGGGPENAKNWMLFKGIIQPTWIVEVKELRKKVYPPSVQQGWKEYMASAHRQKGKVTA